MEKILNNIKNNIYASSEMIDKYIYFKRDNKDAFLYYIFSIKSINVEDDKPNIIYDTKKCYLLFVPKDENRQVFLYDNYKSISISNNDELFELTFTEFVNTFRVFVKNDMKLTKELPTKIIQDNC